MTNAARTGVGVIGLGSYLPEAVRTNDELAAQFGLTADWITQRTGIRERHVRAPGENAADLAAKAVEAALASAGLTVDDLDVLLLAAPSHDDSGPATACRAQALLGATNAVALDVGASCSGWMFAARIAVDWIRSGGARHVAVVGSSVYTPWMDPADRSTTLLFGDGAGATILGPVADGEGFSDIHLGSDGTKADYIYSPAGGNRMPPTPDNIAAGFHYARMNGRAIAEFTLEMVPRIVDETLERAGLDRDDLALVVSHQPNPLLLQQACELAKLPSDRVIVVGDRIGNIGPACIPYVLHQSHLQGRLAKGDRALVLAFGAGMTWGGTVLTWSGL